MKKGVLGAILLSAFIIGMALGSAPTPSPAAQSSPPVVTEPSQLEQAIALYEEAVNEGREYVPYSQQVRQLSVPGMNDNAVARLGQGIGSFLETLVREGLRALVQFFSGLIGS